MESSFPGLFASIARAYLTRYKATEEDLAYVAVKNHENGLLNPKAHVRKKITIEDVMRSPVVASPLKLYDCCPFSDGASALILCSEEFAKKKGGSYIEIIGSGRGASPGCRYNLVRISRLFQSTVNAPRQAYEMAKITPKDVDFAEVHDCFTIAEVIDTEESGLLQERRSCKCDKVWRNQEEWRDSN